MGGSIGDRVMALARIVGAIRGYRLDLHLGGDLAQQLGQHRRVAELATGDFDGTDFQRLFIDTDVDLAPQVPLPNFSHFS